MHSVLFGVAMAWCPVVVRGDAFAYDERKSRRRRKGGGKI